MKPSVQLENYLALLERSLGTIAISEKAEIITEIKSHVLEAQDREPSQSIDSILASLGTPEQVANRYLLERGLTVTKPPKHPIVKWLVIGFLGTMLLSILSIGALIWKFSPLVEIDEEKGRFSVLGGLIDIDGSSSMVVGFDPSNINEGDSFKISGNKDLKKSPYKVDIQFSNASFNFKPARKKIRLEWECKGHGTLSPSDLISHLPGETRFQFEKTNGVKCTFLIPKGKAIFVNGANGKLKFKDIESPVTAEVLNGVISFQPAPDKEYQYKSSVKLGVLDSFPESKAPNSIPIQLSVGSGKIEYRDPNK